VDLGRGGDDIVPAILEECSDGKLHDTTLGTNILGTEICRRCRHCGIFAFIDRLSYVWVQIAMATRLLCGQVSASQ
jgi:hypothetical protein